MESLKVARTIAVALSEMGHHEDGRHSRQGIVQARTPADLPTTVFIHFVIYYLYRGRVNDFSFLSC